MDYNLILLVLLFHSCLIEIFIQSPSCVMCICNEFFRKLFQFQVHACKNIHNYVYSLNKQKANNDTFAYLTVHNSNSCEDCILCY